MPSTARRSDSEIRDEPLWGSTTSWLDRIPVAVPEEALAILRLFVVIWALSKPTLADFDGSGRMSECGDGGVD